LPATHHSAQPLTIPLLVTPSDGILVHAVEDAVPTGWTVLTISHGGNYDARNRKVKWGPFFDAGQRDPAYTAQPPAITNVSFAFTVQASFDGRNLPSPVSRTVQPTTEDSSALMFTAAQLDVQGPRFTLCGAASTSYVLEVSTNLVSWTPLQTITTDPSGLYVFRPANPGQSARRFYRGRTP
jgi:hypothetical protein